MKKYGLLVTSPISASKNIGDYIQSLAALQFLPEGCEYDYIEKEDISNYTSDERVKCIMNAWYIWHPENWPPKESCIEPLMTSIHITPLTAEEMLANGGKEYFQKHAPIGCRDTGTLDILKSKGVDSYFSGCLTLTLGNKYKYDGERTGVIFVDPYYTPIRFVQGNKQKWHPLNILKSIGYFLRNPRIILELSTKDFFKGRFRLQTIYNAAIFYHAYSGMFDDSTLLNSEFLTHMISVTKEMGQKELLETAESLVKRYAKAKYVVTSRIHCALPCIGLETPVIFVLDEIMESEQDIFNAPGRFGGLIDFFRIARYDKNRVNSFDEELIRNIKFNENSTFSNKTTWISYRDKLLKQVAKFIDRQKN